jgi:predicted nucleotidyltransferase
MNTIVGANASDWIMPMVERIARDFHPLRIILFGSQARGDAGPDSDIDLLVVLPEVADKRQAAISMRRALAGFPVSKDIVVTTPAEIARRGDLVGTVLRPALREGRILYERR